MINVSGNNGEIMKIHLYAGATTGAPGGSLEDVGAIVDNSASTVL